MHHKLVPDFFLMFINNPKNKLQLINLCKSFRDIIIIPFSTFYTVRSRDKNMKIT